MPYVAALRPLDSTAPAQRVRDFLVKESRGAGWHGQALVDPAPGDEIAPLKDVANTALAGGLAPGSPVALSMIDDSGESRRGALRVWPSVVARVVTGFEGGRPVNDVRFCDPLTYLGSERIWGAFADASPAAVLGGAMSLAVGGDGEPTQEPVLPGLPELRILSDLNGALDTLPYAVAVGEALGVWLARLLPRLGIRVETTTGADGRVELTLRDGEPTGEVLPMIATYGAPSFFGANIHRFRAVDSYGERPALLDNQTAGDVTRLGDAGVVGNVISAAGVEEDEGFRRAGFGARAREVDEKTFTVVSEQFQAHPGGRLGFIASSAFGERTFQIAGVLHGLQGGRYRNTVWLQKDGTAWHPPIPADDGPAVVSGVIDDAGSAVGTAVPRNREGQVPVRLATMPRIAGDNGDAVFLSARAHLPIVNPMGGGGHGFVHAHRQGDLCRVMVHQPLFAEIVGFSYRDDRRLSASFAEVSTGLTVRTDEEGWAGLVFVPKDEMEELLGEWDQLDWETLNRRRRGAPGASPLTMQSRALTGFHWQLPAEEPSAHPGGPAGPPHPAHPPGFDPDEVLDVLDRQDDGDLDPEARRALTAMREELDAAGLREALEEHGVDTAGMSPADLYAAARREVRNQRAAGGFGAAARLAAVVAAFVILAAGAAAAVVALFPSLATNSTLKGLAASGATPPAGSPADPLGNPPAVDVDEATADAVADELEAHGDRVGRQADVADRVPGEFPRRNEANLHRRAADELRLGNDPLHLLESELQQARLRELAGEARYPGDVTLHERVRDAVRSALVAAGATNLVTATQLLQPRVPGDWSFNDAWKKLLEALDDAPVATAVPAVLLLARNKVAVAASGLRKLLPAGAPDDPGAVRDAVEGLRERSENPDEALALEGALNRFDAAAHQAISEGLTRVDAYEPRPKPPLPAHLDKAALLLALERNRQRSRDAAQRYMDEQEPGESNRYRELTGAYSLAIREVKSDFDPTPALREELWRVERNAAAGRLFFPDQHPVYEQAVATVIDVLRENGLVEREDTADGSAAAVDRPPGDGGAGSPAAT